MKILEKPSPEQIAPELVRQYLAIATSLISDNLDRLPGAVGLRPYHAGGQMAGTALTVRTRNGDNLAIHAALNLARPGDVIVVDGGGDLSQALIGEIILAKAESIGVAGFVLDGAIRDLAAIRESRLPCYARGVIHRGPYKNGPGQINVPVAVGGLVVNPGDLVIGDEDGVIAISPQAPRLRSALGVPGPRLRAVSGPDQGQGRAGRRLREAQRHRRSAVREHRGVGGASGAMDAGGGGRAHPRHHR